MNKPERLEKKDLKKVYEDIKNNDFLTDIHYERAVGFNQAVDQHNEYMKWLVGELKEMKGIYPECTCEKGFIGNHGSCCPITYEGKIANLIKKLEKDQEENNG